MFFYAFRKNRIAYLKRYMRGVITELGLRGVVMKNSESELFSKSVKPFTYAVIFCQITEDLPCLICSIELIGGRAGYDFPPQLPLVNKHEHSLPGHAIHLDRTVIDPEKNYPLSSISAFVDVLMRQAEKLERANFAARKPEFLKLCTEVSEAEKKIRDITRKLGIELKNA